MKVLDENHYEDFWRDGYLVIPDAVHPDLLERLRRDFSRWLAESRNHDLPYGVTVDGRPRFDLDVGHRPSSPALRRVNAPIEVSEAFYEATIGSKMADVVAELIGPNVKLHHTKVNSKLPGTSTHVKWHQDFLFTPHSNDDLVTALLMLDDVTEKNGPLEVLPGSHKGELYNLWHDGIFTGSIDDTLSRKLQVKAVQCLGSAGAVCLMHTRLLHGSAPNQSDHARTLHISVYSAEDAVPISPNPMPTKYEGLLVRGAETGRIRSVPYEMKLPELPATASFFDQQAQHAKET